MRAIFPSCRFEHEYDSLSDEEKRIFVRFVAGGPDLFNWLMNRGKPADAELEQMVRLIQTRNRERGLLASDFTRLMALSGSHCSFAGWLPPVLILLMPLAR